MDLISLTLDGSPTSSGHLQPILKSPICCDSTLGFSLILHRSSSQISPSEHVSKFCPNAQAEIDNDPGLINVFSPFTTSRSRKSQSCRGPTGQTISGETTRLLQVGVGCGDGPSGAVRRRLDNQPCRTSCDRLESAGYLPDEAPPGLLSSKPSAEKQAGEVIFNCISPLGGGQSSGA